LTCVIAHLKAGTGSDNESKRKMMIENTMRYLENNYRERNVLIMGDFNLYSSSEPAYQALTNETAYPHSYFIDPLYPYGVGNWNSNYNFKEYHTQSTHKDSDSNCHSSGGMDDRFDFILMSENIYGGRENIPLRRWQLQRPRQRRQPLQQKHQQPDKPSCFTRSSQRSLP